MKNYLLLTMSLFIAGCYEQAPPKGFEAVVPLVDNLGQSGCPNLIDTYLITSAQQHNRLLKEPIDGKDFSYFIIDSLVGNQAYNYVLQMERNQFIHKAQALKANSPRTYFLWRESTLLINKKYSEELVTKILQYGVAYARKGQFHTYGCADGWVKVQEIATNVWDVKTESEYVQQDDVWLARDKYGDLLIHTISYRQKPGWTFWAAGGAGVTLVRINDQWAKMQKAPDSYLTTAWTEADLPIAKMPIDKISQCQLPNMISDFNVRLIHIGLIIEQFSLQPVTVEDGVCIQPPLQLAFSSANSKEGEAIMQSLQNDPIVREVELTETRYANGRLRYAVQVHFRDLENPQ